MYAGYSKIDYTFGLQKFGANTVCKVFETLDSMPNLMNPYTGVSECTVSESTVTILMAVDGTSPSFHVQLTSFGAWTAPASNKIDGNLKSFTTTILKADDDKKKAVMAIGGTAAGQSNTPASDLAVVAARTLINVMDVGMVDFTVTSKNMDFGSGQVAIVSWPYYYNPCVGMVRCELYDVTAKKPLEQLYCKMLWDHTMMIMGPAKAAVKTKAFNIRVYGVNMVYYATAKEFGFGLTNYTTWETSKQLLEYKAAPDAAKAGSW